MREETINKLEEFEKHVNFYMTKTFEDTPYSIVLQEECAELIQAICKFYRDKGGKDKIIEELTHVLISISAFMKFFRINLNDIMEEVRRKDSQL